MKLTIDTSVALKLVISEPGSNEATELAASDSILIAPSVIEAEMANALWSNVLSDRISAEVAMALFDQWQPFFEEFHPVAELTHAALAIALEVKHAVYDCYYLALAIREDAPLITADARFVAALVNTPYREHVRLL